MATGDDAIAAGMANVNGATTPANTIDTEIMLTRDYIARGMGAVALPTANKVMKRDAFGRVQVAAPSAAGDAATKAYVDAVADSVAWPVEGTPATFPPSAHTHNGLSQGAVTFGWNTGLNAWYTPEPMRTNSDCIVAGHVYVPNAIAAVSGYTIAYIDATGRLAKGASSERFKDDIQPIDPASLGDLFPVLHTFVMKDDPGKMQRVGYIAERLDESDDLRRFVVYERTTLYEQVPVYQDEELVGYENGAVIGSTRSRDEAGNPIPESIDFVALLLAQVAQLHARVAELEGRS